MGPLKTADKSEDPRHEMSGEGGGAFQDGVGLVWGLTYQGKVGNERE